jgi:hypothetical protein
VARAALVLLGITLGLGALELVARWRFGRPLPLEGEWLDLTKLGFRYGIHRIEKDPLCFRVVGIGDSFAYGVVQPSFNYHHLLERQLATRLKRPVEVINLGWPASGPAMELAILEGLGLRFQPDVVLWTFFLGNDLTDDRPGSSYTLEEILQRRHWEKSASKTMEVAWYERLRLAGYVRFLILHLRNAGLPGPSREGARGLNAQSFLALETLRLAMLLNDHGTGLAFERKVRPALEKAADLCRDRGTPLVLAIAPDQALVESDLAAHVLESLRESGRLEPADRQRFAQCHATGDLSPLTTAPRLLAELGALEGMRVVDLLSDFRERGRNGGLYADRDTHWNRAGNELAASILVEPLVEISKEAGQEDRPGEGHGKSKSNSPATSDAGDSAPPVPRTVTR